MMSNERTAAAAPRDRAGRVPLTRDRIREAASRVFAEKGYAAASLQDVASAVGTTRTALYHHVASKDELLIDLVEDLAARARAALAEVTRSSDDPLATLAAAVRRLVRFAAENQQLVRALDVPPTHVPLAASTALRRLNRPFYRDLTSIVAKGIAEGSVRPVDPATTAQAIGGLTRSLAWWYHPDGPVPIETIADQLVDMVTRGLSADPLRLPRAALEKRLGRIEDDVAAIRALAGAGAHAPGGTGR